MRQHHPCAPSYLARAGRRTKVASATFFTAQVDFEKLGELKYFAMAPALTLADQLSGKGYLDGRQHGGDVRTPCGARI
ncbi:MAG: hypothetical protein R3D83_03050 [Caenibius sp.]